MQVGGAGSLVGGAGSMLGGQGQERWTICISTSKAYERPCITLLILYLN